MVVKLGQGVVFRPGTSFDERWAPNQYLSGFVTSIFGDDASIVVFPDVYAPFYEMRVKRDDSLSEERTWTPAVGESQTMPEAPSDGQIYGRRNQAWTPVSGEDQGYIQAVIVSDEPPKAGLVGMAWFDTTINNFFIFEQGKWIEPGHVNAPLELPINLVAPLISGTVSVGSVLYCTTGDWSGEPINYAFQWRRDGVNISGAISTGYTITLTDVGTDLACMVTATNRVGLSQPALSNIVSVKAPTIISAPILAGKVLVNEQLVCSNGIWANDPISFTFQWTRDGVNIVGATTNAYIIVAGDADTTLACIVTATNLIGTSLPAKSNDVTIAVPFNTKEPLINADSELLFTGTTLTCFAGDWDNLPTSYSYQWKRNGSSIAGAVNNTYLLAPVDLGTTITCVVIAANAIGPSLPATSDSSVILKGTEFDPATALNSQLATAGGGTVSQKLRVTHTTTTTGGASTFAPRSTGKWVFEVSITVISGTGTGFGLLQQGGSYGDMVLGSKSVVVRKDGQIWVNGSWTGGTLGPLVNDYSLIWVVDLDGGIFWVRRVTGQSEFGPWNGDPAAFPGVFPDGTGGLFFGSMAGDEFAPAICFGGTGSTTSESAFFHFGAEALLTAAPSGFVSGWPM